MAIVGCSNDPTHKNLKFAEDNHFSFPLLSDTGLDVAVKFGAATNHYAPKARRIALLIDESGIISKVYDPAGTGEFPAQVLDDVKKDEL